ncbi:sensor histidine kinase LiaS [Rhodobiaceae bacterium]|nr:sensor histidine kinase LiaS [Rhodobiaceae bacterium]
MVSHSPTDTEALLSRAPREFRGPFTRWPRAADTVLAFILFIATLFIWFQGPDDTPAFRTVKDIPPEAVLIFATANAAIIWRRKHPIVVFIAVQAISVLSRLIGLEEFVLFAAVVMLYSVGRYTDNDRWSFIAIGCAVLLSGVGELVKAEPWPVISGALLMPFLVWYTGRRIRTRGDYMRLLQDHASHLEREQDYEARRAVADERTRIARELHDVVAHRVSMMTVQAGAAKTVAAQKPEEALKAMEAVEAAGREALDELRHILGVLRPDPDGDDHGPQPGLADVPLLVEQVQKAGLSIELKMDPLAPLPARVDLSAFRIIQEALTNVMKHAGSKASTDVTLFAKNGWITIQVTNQGENEASFPQSGFGIAGMRERAELLGGSLKAGPRPGGGFHVVARLPMGSEAT